MKPKRSHKQEKLAELYDAEILPLWSHRFGRMLLRDLSLPPKAMILDVGCGTGYPALDVLRRMDDQGRIVAIDPSQPMLAMARAKAGALSGKRIFFRSEGIETRLSFDNDVYDLVVSNLGLVDVDDAGQALAEFARVTKPGGRVIATTPLIGTFGEFYDLFREVLIKRDRAEALARLDQWLTRYPTHDEAAEWLHGAGLIDVAVEHETFQLLFKSSREFFFAPIIEYGPLPDWKELAGKGQEMQETFWQIKESIDAYFGSGPFSLTVAAGCLRGRKPLGEEERSEPPQKDSLSRRGRIPLTASTAGGDTGEIVLGTGEIDLIDLPPVRFLDEEDDEEEPL